MHNMLHSQNPLIKASKLKLALALIASYLSFRYCRFATTDVVQENIFHIMQPCNEIFIHSMHFLADESTHLKTFVFASGKTYPSITKRQRSNNKRCV